MSNLECPAGNDPTFCECCHERRARVHENLEIKKAYGILTLAVAEAVQLKETVKHLERRIDTLERSVYDLARHVGN